MHDSKSKIALFLINYGNDLITAKSLKTFQHEKGLDKYVLNNKHDDSQLSDSIKSAKVIQMDKNYGYFGALIEFASNNKLSYEWIILANNDVFLNSELIKNIEEISKNKSDIGVIAPSILELDGREINPHLIKKLGLLAKIYFNIYFTSYGVAIILRIFKKLIFKKKINTKEYNNKIYSANGAFLIMHKHIFAEVLKRGSLGFLYGEEILVSDICDKLNQKVFFTNKIKLTHSHSESTGKAYSRKKFNWQKQVYKESKAKGYKHYKI